MLDFNKWEKCTGCSACKSACPRNAIHLEISNNGFFNPVIDSNLCINCGKCEIVCPASEQSSQLLEHEKADCYYVYSKDNQMRTSSSSGGLFFELASAIISGGG